MTEGIPYEKPRLLEPTMTKLLPCPFCGRKAHVIQAEKPLYSHIHKEGWYVECDYCYVSMGLDFLSDNASMGAFATEADAIAAWNRRADA